MAEVNPSRLQDIIIAIEANSISLWNSSLISIGILRFYKSIRSVSLSYYYYAILSSIEKRKSDTADVVKSKSSDNNKSKYIDLNLKVFSIS